MQTAVAQMIALVTYGNAVLQGKSLPKNFFPGNSSFTSCKEVAFVNLEVHGDHYHQHPYAPDPISFFLRLKDEGYKSLRLAYAPYDEDLDMPDWMLAGFVGSGTRWLLEAYGPQGTDYWEARWETSEDDPAEGEIWHVSYGRIARHHDSVPPGPNHILEIKDDFSRNLPLIIAFARRHDLAAFVTRFEAALTLLSKDDPLQDVYHKDLAPDGVLPLGAQRLLAAAQAAWIFGGMGSWSDLSFEGNQHFEYVNLSSGLYRILLAAVTEAANTSV